MNYTDARETAETGDILLVEGRGWVGKVIRALTGQQFSHVAILLHAFDGLWVAEMREGRGFLITPASQWTRESRDQVYLGMAPLDRAARVRVGEAIVGARLWPHRYSYWSLLTIWIAQVLRIRTPAALVCSTFVQRCWEHGGVAFPRPADPGDLAPLCEAIYPVTWGTDPAQG
jgi:hypothetical protein